MENKIKQEVERLISIGRACMPDITDTDLDRNGAIIFCNGRNGTDFDYKVNKHLPRFTVFHKNETGFVTVIINKTGKVDIYVYTDKSALPDFELSEKLHGVTVSEMYTFLYNRTDAINRFDVELQSI